MEHHKSQFIVDNYIQIGSREELINKINTLSQAGVLFVVEPWAGDNFRIYVRKDAEDILKIVEEN